MIRPLICVAIFTAIAAACAGGESAPSDGFCLGGYQDDVRAYLTENADAVAEQLIQDNLVILREASETHRFRTAERSNGQCRQGEELLTAARLQEILNESVQSPSTQNSDECTVQLPLRSEEESWTIFRYLGLSGLRGLVVATNGPGFEIMPDGTRREWAFSSSVTSSDGCDALNAVVGELIERRTQLN